MSNFQEFAQKVNTNFKEKMYSTRSLYRANVSGKQIWELYLNSFKKGDDKTFRDPNSSTHNCNNCYNFFKRYGNIVTVNDQAQIKSIFDVDVDKDSAYYPFVQNIKKAAKKFKIGNLFVETFNELRELPYEKNIKKNQEKFILGIPKNVKKYTLVEAQAFQPSGIDELLIDIENVYTFHHFFLEIPNQLINKDGRSKEDIEGEHKQNVQVLLRGLTEIGLDSLELTVDLIKQGSLMNGESHLKTVEGFIEVKKEFEKKPSPIKAWQIYAGIDRGLSKFKNTLIGTFCYEISSGVELNQACLEFNKRVDPLNYKKAKAPVSKKQLADAQKLIVEKGYEESFERRIAELSDIKVSDIIHLNADGKKAKEAKLFDSVKANKPSRHKKENLDKVPEISIDNFMDNFLENTEEVEIFLENKHQGNLVALTTSVNDSKSPFMWNNSFSWTYSGNLAGKSNIRSAVTEMGGDIVGYIRFSIMWAEKDGDNSDLDAHCQTPSDKICYKNKVSRLGGILDVDITQPRLQRPKGAVENIVFKDNKKLKPGTYRFFVHQFAARGSKGFKAEFEINGEVFEYAYDKKVQGSVDVVEVKFDKKGDFTIKHRLTNQQPNKEIWNLETNNFHKVNLVCNSPNHWGDNNFGNKHYLFMVDGCKPTETLRGFHNENLNSELREIRKQMELLANAKQVEPTKNSLAGLGFSSKCGESVLLKLKGSHQRIVRVTF